MESSDCISAEIISCQGLVSEFHKGAHSKVGLEDTRILDRAPKDLKGPKHSKPVDA